MEQQDSAAHGLPDRPIFPVQPPSTRAPVRPVSVEEFWRMTARHDIAGYATPVGPVMHRAADSPIGPDPAAPGRPWSFGSTGRRWRFSLRRRSPDQPWYDDPV